jgi:hypothetical protein
MSRAWTLCYCATVRTEEEKEKEMHAPFPFFLFPYAFFISGTLCLSAASLVRPPDCLTDR